MGKIYATVMLSNPLEDEDRFRKIIDEAIASGDVEGYKAYVNETQASKDRRMKNAEREGAEAMAYAEELGVAEKLFGSKAKGKAKPNGDDALMALIQKRQKDRGSFLDDLEAKYAPKAKSKAKKGKKRASSEEEDDEEDVDEPSEEAFQAAAARLKNGKSKADNNGKAKVDTGDTRRSKRTKR
jgi:DnaJ family protein C protein 9